MAYDFSDKATVYIKANNLFDKNIFSQPFGGGGTYDTQWEGRLIRAGYQYRF